jgi:hypothetical protein
MQTNAAAIVVTFKNLCCDINCGCGLQFKKNWSVTEKRKTSHSAPMNVVTVLGLAKFGMFLLYILLVFLWIPILDLQQINFQL